MAEGGKTNWTDPVVWHDPVLAKETVVKIYNAPGKTKAEEDEHVAENYEVINMPIDQVKTDGVIFPIIQLNNINIDQHHVESMELIYSGFIPKLNLTIRDIGKFIQFNETPGINNIIKLIIIPPKDGAYRKISLSFKITNYSVYGEYLYYTCEYKLDDLNKDMFTSINFNGCGDCGKSANPLPNTWEYLHHISKTLGLGFASTEECKDIADNLPRLLQNITYNDFINKSIRYGGLDEKSIFDCWIDLYGYVVLVNLPWVFNENIKASELELVTNLGMINTMSGLPDNNIDKVKRTLTNYPVQGTVNNMSIESYKDESSPSIMYYNGNMHTITEFKPLGANDGNSNNIATEDILSKEYSIDGDFSDEYTISKKEPVKSVFCGYNIHKQQTIRDLYLNKIRTRKLEVVLSNYNLGLQRGTLVNVSIFEDDAQKKSKIMTSSSKVLGSTDDVPDKEDILTSENILNEGNVIINIALSGLYYIDGMEFTYDSSIGKIKQKLILLKKGIRSNFNNKHTPAKIKNETK